MTISTFSIIGIAITSLMPFVWTIYAKVTGPGFNNSTTRDYAEKLTGRRRRAHYAHLNSFEALPLFIASVLIANINHVEPTTLHTFIGAYLVFRLIYGFFYIFDLSTLRSLTWFLGILCNLGLLYLSL